MQKILLLISFFLPLQIFSQINPEKINIVRDQWGVPHIFAKTDAEVAYGLAWAAAKQVLSRMLQEVTAWIQSGFRGRPLFVEDIEGFLKEITDGVLGEFIEDLGEAGSFLCRPFRIDVRVALENSYRNNFINQRPQFSCRLTDIIGNIDDFISGGQGSFSQGGGWNNWFTLTSNPDTYTPFGGYQTADALLEDLLTSRQSADLRDVENGNGFRSVKICDGIPTATGDKRQDCEIRTPGSVIVEQLSQNLGNERDSLVQADEITEILVAFLGAVSKDLFKGSNDLLQL